MFTSPVVSPTHKKLYQLIVKHYTNTQEELSYDLLQTYANQSTEIEDEAVNLGREIEAIRALELGNESLDLICVNSLHNYTLSDILINAHRTLTEYGTLDISSVISSLSDVEKGILHSRDLELFSPDLASQIIAEEENCFKYPTTIPGLDRLLNGGLWEQEIGFFLGETHIGKTWALTFLGAAALRSSLPVIHFTGEISKRRSYIRYYQNLLNMQRMDVMMNPSQVREKLGTLNLPPWAIVDFSSRKYTTSQLRQDVLRFAEACDKPPLILVDYADKLSATNRALEGRFALGDIVEALRRLACEVTGGLWTASQVHRAAYGEEYVRKENVSEAISKVEIADVIITLNQTPEERQHLGQMRWKVDKARERTLPPDRQVYLRCLPETQSFEENLDVSQAEFERWAG